MNSDTSMPRQARVVHCKRAPAGTFKLVDRTTIFGNPFALRNKHDDLERESVISRYRDWFEERLTDPQFVDALETLRGWDLGCWCATKHGLSSADDLRCHGQVILQWIENST